MSLGSAVHLQMLPLIQLILCFSTSVRKEMGKEGVRLCFVADEMKMTLSSSIFCFEQCCITLTDYISTDRLWEIQFPLEFGEEYLLDRSSSLSVPCLLLKLSACYLTFSLFALIVPLLVRFFLLSSPLPVLFLQR